MSHDNGILLVFLALITKHYFFDFVYQTGYMLMGKGKGGLAWIAPLALHSFAQALPTFLIFLVYSPRHAWVGLVDFGIHFVVDRVKATYPVAPTGPWLPQDRIRNLGRFYAALGLDQAAHYATYILCMYLCLNF